jgi:hypothetical protein
VISDISIKENCCQNLCDTLCRKEPQLVVVLYDEMHPKGMGSDGGI